MRVAPAWLAAITLVVGLGSGAAAGADTYTVRAGDTLTSVAARAGVDPGRLAAVNGIVDPDHIRAGQVLDLAAVSYRIRPGDTLWDLAPRLGVPEAGLVAANRLGNPDLITAGRTLAVPPGPVTGRAARHTAATATAAPVTTVPRPRATTPTTAATRTTAAPSTASHASSSTAAAAVAPARPALVTVRRPFTCPVAGARFVDDFGYVKPDGTVHQGVDLMAPRRTPVVAPVSGMLAPYPNPKGGKAFQLFGDDGNRYYGAHLDAFGHTGRVTAGTVIGYVGNTGDAAGGPTHLHFEFHPGAGPDAASPYPLLASACR